MTKTRLTIDPAAFDPAQADPELVALNEKIIRDQKALPDPWSLPVETSVELCEHWGYALELQSKCPV